MTRRLKSYSRRAREEYARRTAELLSKRTPADLVEELAYVPKRSMLFRAISAELLTRFGQLEAELARLESSSAVKH